MKRTYINVELEVDGLMAEGGGGSGAGSGVKKIRLYN